MRDLPKGDKRGNEEDLRRASLLEIIQKLYFKVLFALLKERNSLIQGHFFAYIRNLVFGNIAHFLLNAHQVLRCDGTWQLKIVKESMFNHGAYAQFGTWIQFFYRRSQKVRGRM